MHDFFTVNALVRKIGTKTTTYKNGETVTHLQTWLFFEKEAVDIITEFLEPESKANKKRTFHLKPLNRDKNKNVPESYTHEMNMDTNIEYPAILDLYGNDIEYDTIGMGDIIMVSGTEKLSKQQETGELFLGAYLKSMALIKPRAVEIKLESASKIDLLKRLEAMREDNPDEHLPL